MRKSVLRSTPGARSPVTRLKLAILKQRARYSPALKAQLAHRQLLGQTREDALLEMVLKP